MIDPSFDTVEKNAFITPYPPTMQELEQKVADLENKLSLKTQQWELSGEYVRKYDAQVARFEEALKHNEWDFDQDTLESLANFFDITLEREYEVTITVTFSGTVTAPYGYDMDDLENDLQATIDTHHYGNSDVVVEFSEDSMEIDCQEI